MVDVLNSCFLVVVGVFLVDGEFCFDVGVFFGIELFYIFWEVREQEEEEVVDDDGQGIFKNKNEVLVECIICDVR